MDELKPCPFCGSTKLGISEKSTARDYGTAVQYRVTVYCKKCNTYGPRVLTEKVKSNVYPRPFVDFENAKEKASEAWNSRAYKEATIGTWASRKDGDTNG